MFASMHRSVALCSKRMLVEMRRHNYVTPTNYLELVDGYKKSVYLLLWPGILEVIRLQFDLLFPFHSYYAVSVLNANK